MASPASLDGTYRDGWAFPKSMASLHAVVTEAPLGEFLHPIVNLEIGEGETFRRVVELIANGASRRWLGDGGLSHRVHV